MTQKNASSTASRLSALSQRTGVRYLFIGGSVYLLELLVIVVAEAAGSNPLFAVGLSFWIGLLVSFGLQKVVAFGDTRSQKRIVGLQFLMYALLVLFNFGFTLVCIQLLEPYLPTALSRAVALGITVIWNFYIYKTRLFKPSALPEV